MSFSINTGMPRSVTGHVISGALTASIIAAGIGYGYSLKQKKTKKDIAKNTLKLGLQGGIATGSAIAATNYIGSGNYFKALTSIGIGFCGIMALDQINSLKLKDAK